MERGSGDKDTLGVRLALAVLRGYKVAISPYFRGSCRFLPTCADYAAIAIARHGLTYGSWLAARRLIRCHPLCAAGHDPVPLAPFRGPVRLRAWLSGVTTPKLVPIAGDGRREGLQHSK